MNAIKTSIGILNRRGLKVIEIEGGNRFRTKSNEFTEPSVDNEIYAGLYLAAAYTHAYHRLEVIVDTAKYHVGAVSLFRRKRPPITAVAV